jgi:nicotinate dehydrogenase subunit B
VANRDGTVVAALVDVQVERSTGKIQVTHVTIAHDCGLIVNPDGLRNQIEGNVIQGVSRALYEEVHFDETGVTNLDWNEYPVVRFNAVPTVDIVLLNRPELGYLGAGEAAIVPIPAAIANALFDATGARVREVPLTPERVLQAMKSSRPQGV